jgi:hypothetical protein
MNMPLSCGRLTGGFVVGLFTLILGVSPVAADVFTIDTNLTSCTISGSITISGFTSAILQQAPGSLTTIFGGTVQATQTPGTIQFTGLSLITALTNGNWAPLASGGAGNAPANYGAHVSFAGGFVTADVALRSVLFDVTSPPVPVSSGQFNPSGLTFLFPATATSSLDYRPTSFVTPGTKLLAGYASTNVANLASLATVGTQQTLTIAVDTTFNMQISSPGDTVVRVVGQLVATRTVTPQVVIQSITVTNQAVTLKWQSVAGQFFSVLSSSNLQTWQTNASNITSGSTNYAWTGANPAPQGFYRLAY